MAHKAADGFIAPRPTKSEFTVIEYLDNGREKRRRPSGIFVHGNRGNGIFLNYAGLKSSSLSAFKLPSDPQYLRDIATALEMMADELES